MAENFDKLHERVMSFVGSFAANQFFLDYIVHRYMTVKMPTLGPVISGQFLERVRDDQRLRLFTSVAEDADYQGDLTHFDFVFNRAKQVRDYVAHAAVIHESGNQRGYVKRVVVVSYTGVSGKKKNRPLVPDPLLPSHFDQLRNDVKWMGEHANYLGQESGCITVKTLTGDPMTLPMPPALPVDGLPL